MTPIAYQLLWSTEHLLRTDDRYDLVLERADEHQGVSHYWPTEPQLPKLPDPIVFAANFGTVIYTDYPNNDQDWPIMSRRMLETLLSVGSFPHGAIPIAIIDPIVYEDGEGDDPDFVEKRLQTANRDYVIVQLTEHLDILNEEKSVIRRSKSLPGMVTIREYVLNESEEGLPPLFRLSINSVPLFISAQARKALAEAGIRGPVYLPLEGYTNGQGDETDVPVTVPEMA